MALRGPGVPSKGTPRSRARGFAAVQGAVRSTEKIKRGRNARRDFGIKVLRDKLSRV
jgi:hypothetical protein